MANLAAIEACRPGNTFNAPHEAALHAARYLFEELWMQPDHETLAAHAPEGFTMTGFRQLALADCDGRATPLLCSGLAIASR